ncbi:STAS domain-containing protein [Streptosporangium sp. NPDC023825]|uniref:STAS domain-containing protein n=1 Tax=Streptosporangium sp. NPDC023825 TaxID=3154909 RepID=UPI003432F325
MDLSTHAHPDWMVCDVAGKIDIFTANALREHLLAALGRPGYRLLLDMSMVTAMDASGVAVLLSTLRRAVRHGGTLRLIAPAPVVRGLLKVSGLSGKFAVSADLAGARIAEPLPAGGL